MSSPAPETLSHVLIPLDANGEGPCADEDACEYRCWCGVRGCTEWQ